MKKFVLIAVLAVGSIWGLGCSKENNGKDRSQATEMYERICSLTNEYTDKLKAAPDSADWADVCAEFEEKLDKISFSYPPDTDLLLTEGQNDTIHHLMQEYVRARGSRLHGMQPPMEEADSMSCADSDSVVDAAVEPIGG